MTQGITLLTGHINWRQKQMLDEHNTKVSYVIGVKLAEHLQEVLKNKIRDICSEQHQQAAIAEYLKPE